MFARKELRSNDLGRFREELRNLEHVKRPEDPHLVKLIKAYKHGDRFNFIFPRAKTNLDQYLRDPAQGAPQGIRERPELSPLWIQALNITKALER